MSKVKITIDGTEVLAEEGSNLLEVAREHGFKIPSLCHDPRLTPFGACRQCLVEIQGARGLVQACGAKVSAGMVVKTNTQKVIDVRRMGLEFIFAEHNGDCIAPCQQACPAGIDIQGFIAHLANGQISAANQLIREKLPFPSSIGRVCPAFCEEQCRRNLVDEPVSICYLKRYAGDWSQVDEQPLPSAKDDTGKQVAVIGGGPAGLSAAYYLALEGHRVTIFDAAPKLGGMMRYGIPKYRLPRDVLDQEIKVITDLCQNVFNNKALGRDFTVAQLKQQGFDAVFLGIGSWANIALKLPGEDLQQVYSGIGFLNDVASGNQVKIGQRVVVIGGGNVAMDAARTSVRLGAKEVTVVYRRTRNEMPASNHEINQALEEGVKFQMLTAPMGFSGPGDTVDTLNCIKMELGEPDESGRCRPVPVQGSEFAIPADTVITAVGQRLEKASLAGSEEISLTGRGNILVDDTTMQTNIPWLFAGGDCVSGPKTAVEAVGAGRRAAISINQYLQEQVVRGPKQYFNISRGRVDEIDQAEYAHYKKIPRAVMPTVEPATRKVNFEEFELGFTPQLVKEETQRCLACGCQEVFNCKLREYATELNVSTDRLGIAPKTYPVFYDHPQIVRDPNKCILCGLCVRVCQEVVGLSILGFVDRGSDTVVYPTLKRPLAETNCNSCGQCVAVCPTGALVFTTNLDKEGPWETKPVASVCNQCNIGCRLQLNVAANQVVNITSPVKGNDVNEGYLCNKGTFNHQIFNSSQRLQVPLIKEGDTWQQVTWQQAIEQAVHILKTVRDIDGLDSIAVAISPKLTNEENYLAYKVARMALGTNKIFSTADISNANIMAAINKLGPQPSGDDLILSDLILAVGDIAQNYPVMAYKIRKAVEKNSKLIIINSHTTSLDGLADQTIPIKQQQTLNLLETFISYVIHHELVDERIAKEKPALIDELTNKIKDDFFKVSKSFLLKPQKLIKFIHLFVEAKNPIIIIDGQTIPAEELKLLSQLALVTGNLGEPGKGLITLYPYGNINYQLHTGILPNAEEQLSNIKALLVLGDGAELNGALLPNGVKRIEITPVLSSKLKADVVLPGATFTENDGTVLNYEGKMQRLVAGLQAPGGKQNWQILVELAKGLGLEQTYNNETEIHCEMVKNYYKI